MEQMAKAKYDLLLKVSQNIDRLYDIEEKNPSDALYVAIQQIHDIELTFRVTDNVESIYHSYNKAKFILIIHQFYHGVSKEVEQLFDETMEILESLILVEKMAQ